MSKPDEMVHSATPWVAIPVNIDGVPAYEAIRYDNFVETLFKRMNIQLMFCHAAMGVNEEAGEISDQIKKHVMYSQDLNVPALTKELGDLLFYFQAVLNLTGITWNDVLQQNALKLSDRYKGLVYSDEAAAARRDETGQS